LSPKALIGLTAGAIAGIVIGAAIAAGLVAFGTTKGLVDYYKNKNENLAAATQNPLYKDANSKGDNKLYEPKNNI